MLWANVTSLSSPQEQKAQYNLENLETLINDADGDLRSVCVVYVLMCPQVWTLR